MIFYINTLQKLRIYVQLKLSKDITFIISIIQYYFIIVYFLIFRLIISNAT